MSYKLKQSSKLVRVLENPSLFSLLLYELIPSEILKFRLLDSTLKNIIEKEINSHLDKVEYRFRNQYQKQLILETKQNYEQVKYKTNRKLHEHFWLRRDQKGKTIIDIKLYFKVNYSMIPANSLCTLSYSFQLQKTSKSKQKLYWKNCFQTTKDSKIQYWIYNENSKSNDYLPYLMDAPYLKQQDIGIIRIPLFRSNQLINMHNISFYPLEREKVSFCCEIQRIQKWYKYDYQSQPLSFQLEDIIHCHPELDPQSIEVSVSQKHYRVRLKAKKQLPLKSYLQHRLQICAENDKNLRVELKKKGAEQNSRRNIQLRVGDGLIIYLMIHE